MRVISTDPRLLLPAREGEAELLNSSLALGSDWTVCARLLTHQFSTYPDMGPLQADSSTLIGRDIPRYLGHFLPFYFL